jgi:hypothetical protein
MELIKNRPVVGDQFPDHEAAFWFEGPAGNAHFTAQSPCSADLRALNRLTPLPWRDITKDETARTSVGFIKFDRKFDRGRTEPQLGRSV